jgi:uncharacterized surface protein with fasciclin (FAS1) repeats
MANQYVIGFGITNEHFRQFVFPLPNHGDDENDKDEDINGILKYNGYFIENLYFDIPTPLPAYQFMEQVFEIDYAYAMRREYRRQKELAENAALLFHEREEEDRYVVSKFSQYKSTREIPVSLKNVQIAFVPENDSDITFCIGLPIEKLSEWDEKSSVFKMYAPDIENFFNLENSCICIYKTK